MSAGDGGPEMQSDALLRQHLHRLYPLNQMSPDALARLLPALRVVRYAAKSPLYGAGDCPVDCYYVLEGCVWLYDRDGGTPQLKIRAESTDEAMPLPYAVPADERAVVVEDSIILQVDRALVTRARRQVRAPTPAPAPAPVAAAPPQPAPPRSNRILLVEHQPDEAAPCRTVLKSMGLPTDWVRSAEEAIELLGIEQYGAVILDLHLPDGDSFDVVKSVRERIDGASRPRLVALAAAGDDREGCLAAGMDEFIGRPVSAIAMRAALGRTRAPALETQA